MNEQKRVSVAATHEVRDTCLCLHTQRAARALARRFDAALRPLGVTNGQFSLLMALSGIAAPTVGDVADLLGMDRTTLTSSLKPLARRGLVQSRKDEADRRMQRLVLTSAGKALLVAALPVWRREHRAVEASLAADPNRARRLLAALSKSGR